MWHLKNQLIVSDWERKKKFGAMAYFWVISSDIGWVITVHHQHSEVEWL